MVYPFLPLQAVAGLNKDDDVSDAIFTLEEATRKSE